jgi:hypothetical protein
MKMDTVDLLKLWIALVFWWLIIFGLAAVGLIVLIHHIIRLCS